MRQITLTFDRENYGGWPFGAETSMPDGTRLSAHGPTAREAVRNIRRLVEEHIVEPSEYPKVVEVDW